ncbi:hypothetical protein [Gordonia terrae]
MIHHWSFNANDPQRVVEVLAEIMGGHVIKPPIPPYEEGARWLCMLDEYGTMIEVGPIDACKYPNADWLATIEAVPGSTQQYSYNHALCSAAIPLEQVREIAEREGWPTSFFDGPFKFQGVWIESRQYIEFASPDVLKDYTDLFGSNITAEALNAHNRRREQELRELASGAASDQR